MDYSRIRLLSFDCYGTLVDWKKSVAAILLPVFGVHRSELDAETLFNAFLRSDRKLEKGPYKPYREVLAEIVQGLGNELGIPVEPSDRYILSERFEEWMPFPDTIESLRILGEKYRLAVISNVDDDLFAITRKRLGVEFDHILTAQQLGSYKPDPENFRQALGKFALPREEVLHVAQSIYHDILPSNALGWNNVWVNRYGEPERTNPDEFPDLEVPDLTSLVRILKIETGR